MQRISSQSANNRVTGRFQVDAQRDAILEAAEKVFLEMGIENTSMQDIARSAGINRTTLYRYFANRDEVAVAVHLRLMKKTAEIAQFDLEDRSLEGYKRRVQAVIRNFPRLRDYYRLTGMFDKIYLDHPYDSPLTQWTLNRLILEGFTPQSAKSGMKPSETAVSNEEITVIMNAVVWFLEKLALRGELTWSDHQIPLEEHLKIFEQMVAGYFDRLIETHNQQVRSGDAAQHLRQE